MEFDTKDFEKFICIGTDCAGKKFRLIYSNYMFANGINMYRGNMYGVRRDGKRVKLKTVWN